MARSLGEGQKNNMDDQTSFQKTQDGIVLWGENISDRVEALCFA